MWWPPATESLSLLHRYENQLVRGDFGGEQLELQIHTPRNGKTVLETKGPNTREKGGRDARSSNVK